MKYEDEITVEVSCSFEKLKSILEENNFIIMEEYDVNDIYMLEKSYSSIEDNLELLKHCVLVRDIVEKDKSKSKITYKYKEYNDNLEIIKQGKIDCVVESKEAAKRLLEALNYEELLKINDHVIVLSNGTDEINVELVNNKHIYIEIEQKCNYIDKKYSDVKDMKEVFDKYNIPLKDNNYFVKKAEVELIELKENLDNKNHRMNKKELLNLLDSLKISKDEFTILSSSALVLREILPDAGDLDIAVSKKGLGELKKNYNVTQKENVWYIVTDKIECVLDDMTGKKENLEGYNLQDIYNYLSYLKSSSREKDKKRIPIVEKYIKSR